MPEAEPQLSPPVRISSNDNVNEDPSVVRARDGRFYIVWSSKAQSGVRLRIKSSEDGRKWTGEEPVTSGSGEDYFPSLIQSRNGTFHLVWFRLEKKLKDMDIWYARSQDGRTWTSPVQLSHAPEPDWAPVIHEDARGTLRVVWSSSQTGNRELFMTRSEDGGRSWSPEEQMTHSEDEDDFPQLIETSSGGWILAWTRYRKGSRLLSYMKDGSAEIVMSRSSDGKNWSTPEIGSPPDQKHRYVDLLPFVFADSSGSHFYLSWTSSRTDRHGDILLRDLSKPSTEYQRLTMDGKSDYDAKIVRTQNPGQYLMVWASNREGKTTIYSRLFRL